MIRTRRIPSPAAIPAHRYLVAAVGAVTTGAVLPATPLAGRLGFSPLPGGYFAFLVVMVVLYLGLAEVAKRWFFGAVPEVPAERELAPGHRVHRRAARFTTRALPRRRRRRAPLRRRGIRTPQ